MKKYYIKVPQNIQYISDWGNYEMPKGHCIVDKGVTGCGYTEYCLRNDQNIVLCSPRKLLLENKSEQHQNDKNIFYLKNEIKDYKSSEAFIQYVKELYYSVNNPFEKSPTKFLITYDSTHYVINALKELGVLGNFIFVIDEFQSIFLDSYFKADVEFSFVESLQECPNVLYLSATPMLDKYLKKVPEFMNLDFYELDWSDTGIVENVVIKRKFTKSLAGECIKIIQDYKNGDFPTTYKNGELIESKEMVFYFNSISEILSIINKCGLKPEEANIICADTPNNKKKLKKIGFQIGRIPLKGESNKMFTFCTKTAYIGADFYSDNARTAVFADPNIKSLALDISLDLPQIVGRQRDKSNPFKNDVIVFYRTVRMASINDREKFDKEQEMRRQSTQKLLRIFEKLEDPGEKAEYLKKLRDGIKVSQYSDDFVSISSKTGLPIYNTFIDLANERAWEVAQKDYQDKINVTRALGEISNEILEYKDSVESEVQNFLDNYFYKTGLFTEKMRLYCEFMDNHSEFNQELSDLLYFKIKDDRFRTYYNYFGTSGCRSVRYEEKLLRQRLHDTTMEVSLSSLIHKSFKEGEKYTKKEIKEILKTLHRDLGITKTPKATDLGKYFNISTVNVPNKVTGKYETGFKLSSLVDPDLMESREINIDYGSGDFGGDIKED